MGSTPTSGTTLAVNSKKPNVAKGNQARISQDLQTAKWEEIEQLTSFLNSSDYLALKDLIDQWKKMLQEDSEKLQQ